MTEKPARGYSWPPFERGNTTALRHGAFSTRKLAEVAEALRPTLAGPLDECPWVEAIDGAEVEDWLVREALWRALLGELTRRTEENGGRIADGDRWLLERIGSAQNRAQASRDRLLLNPLNRFRAGRDATTSEVNLDAIAARGRAAWEARDRADSGSNPDGSQDGEA